MEDTKSRVTFSGVNPPHTTPKIIKRHVEKWVNRERSLRFLPKRVSYSVHIDREDYRFYTCHIEIQIGSKEWSGLEEGRSILEAVLNTLKHMKPKDLMEIYRPRPLPAPTQAII
jgi:hypothetical protein